MKWQWLSALLVPLASLSQPASCTPFEKRQEITRRQSSAEGVVTGSSTRDENGNPYMRREVRDMRDNAPDQWNLFMMGLQALMWTEQDNPISYYGLASVHGRPYRTWGNAPGINGKVGGYCPHNNQLFLSWHRPYLALFEQTLQAVLQDIAASAPDSERDRYRRAADAFRIPYWDWAQGPKGGAVPDFFTTETITVTKPDGTQELNYNPFLQYAFHDLVPGDFDEKWATINTTVRWPTTDDATGRSQQDRFINSFAGQQQNILDQMGIVFRSSSFARFAETVEQPHGWMHGIIGGGWDASQGPKGHFWPLEYSAYDPLFMLHHANVDRLFALYQAAHPDQSFTSFTVNNNDNVFLANGQNVDQTTELLPFRRHSGGFWTTQDCWDHTVLGYTYPETRRWQHASDDEYRASVEGVISNLYGATISSSMSTALANSMSSGADSDSDSDNIEKNVLGSARDLAFTDWSIETAAAPALLPPTFVLRFSFVGDFSSDESVDAGTWMILMPSDHGHMSGSQGAKGKDEPANTSKSLHGKLSLTSHLLEQIKSGKLASLEEQDVVPYLRDRLTWKLYSGDSILLPQTALTALSISIVSTQAWLQNSATSSTPLTNTNTDLNALEDATSQSKVKYSNDEKVHPEITAGKPGGAT